MYCGYKFKVTFKTVLTDLSLLAQVIFNKLRIYDLSSNFLWSVKDTCLVLSVSFYMILRCFNNSNIIDNLVVLF
jgi:hypothetical protein